MFDIRKAIAATGYLCERSGGSLNVIHLIKMLYAADRTALVNWHRTITGDKFCSMKNGPVLSRIYSLMCGRILGSDMDAWFAVFNPREGNIISLKNQNVELGSLSKREIEILEKSFKKFKDVPVKQMVDFLHKVLPEWKDPGDSSAPIDPREILFHAGLTPEEVSQIELELDSIHSAKASLQAA
jgi:hypothetical protein